MRSNRCAPPAAEEAGTARSLAELFLDYAGNYLSRGPLCWSPGQIAVFLGDWLPRKTVLDQAHRALLPAVFKRWVTFALTERGVPTPWIAPVVAAVSRHGPRRPPPRGARDNHPTARAGRKKQ